MADTVITTLRLPRSMVRRADALIEVLAEDEEALLLGRLSCSGVLRLAVLRGLEQLEQQAQQRSRGRTQDPNPAPAPKD